MRPKKLTPDEAVGVCFEFEFTGISLKMRPQ